MNNVIFMKPVYKDYIWGGNKLVTNLNKNSHYDKTAESWEISANENGLCEILNQEFAGQTLADLFNNHSLRNEIFGLKCKNMNVFPLLIKFIDANENLSIQVHPDDDYAHSIGKTCGKNELWYIMDCSQDTQIIAGLSKKMPLQELHDSIYNNTLKNYLNYINVQKGDSIYVEAGTIHAILKNNLICEIQQNCDITYRVYDWDRQCNNSTARPLHKKESAETIKPDNKPIVKHTNSSSPIQNLVQNSFFSVDKITVNGSYDDSSSPNSFYAMNVVGGDGYIKTSNAVFNLKNGDSFIIPATLGKFEIAGKIELLKSYIS